MRGMLSLGIVSCSWIACFHPPHTEAPVQEEVGESAVCLDVVVATPVGYELFQEPDRAMYRQCGAAEWSGVCEVYAADEASFGDVYLGAHVRLEPASMSAPFDVCRISRYRSKVRASVLADGRLGDVQIGMDRDDVLATHPDFIEHWYAVFDTNERLVFAAVRVHAGHRVEHIAFDEFHGNNACDLVAVGGDRSGVAWVAPIPWHGSELAAGGSYGDDGAWEDTGFFFISGLHRYDVHDEICAAARHFGISVDEGS